VCALKNYEVRFQDGLHPPQSPFKGGSSFRLLLRAPPFEGRLGGMYLPCAPFKGKDPLLKAVIHLPFKRPEREESLRWSDLANGPAGAQG